MQDDITRIAQQLADGWMALDDVHSRKGARLAGQQAIHRVLDDLISVLFPGCHGLEPVPVNEIKGFVTSKLADAVAVLGTQVRKAFEYQCTVDKCEGCDACRDCEVRAGKVVDAFVKALPGAQEILHTDIVAAYEGDPAARSTMEVVLSYPGLYAIIVHRLAHLLYEQQVPMIPRVMAEQAHSQTGIDIHPGASIGPSFFIDHGTGVVIGETCVIGKFVKLYQGVTLGALSFEKDAAGHLVKGIKRHPNVEDGVVIYAGATILGGNTTIGANSVIGGNVWLTHSVPPYSRVYNAQPKPLIKQADGNWQEIPGPWLDLGAGI